MLVEKLRTRPTSEAPDQTAAIEQKGATAPVLEHASSKGRDLTVATVEPNEDLTHFVDLIDDVLASEDVVHAALFWPHIPRARFFPGCCVK
ncbi:hypothetical protein OCAR_7661 [Afipia carboxidovorans OM5]|nr:hypothetical protein OCAR_7661 [Afipia carboxidovorans OM5]